MPEEKWLTATHRIAREEEFRESSARFGILLTRVPQEDGGHLHSGVVFKRSGQRSRVGYLHVKWDRRIGGQWGEPGVWASPVCSDRDSEDRAELVAEMAEQVRRQFREPSLKRINYGVGWKGSRFVQQGGEIFLEMGDGGYGLTCATLPLALCQGAGIKLIDESTWKPRPEQDEQLVQVAESIGHRHLVTRFRQEIQNGVCRIRPEEVTAAASHPTPPITFTDAVEAGKVVIEVLDAVQSPGIDGTLTRIVPGSSS